ncbi:hypothetical protein ACWIG5_38065 [Streptomyces lydicus]
MTTSSPEGRNVLRGGSTQSRIARAGEGNATSAPHREIWTLIRHISENNLVSSSGMSGRTKNVHLFDRG